MASPVTLLRLTTVERTLTLCPPLNTKPGTRLVVRTNLDKPVIRSNPKCKRIVFGIWHFADGNLPNSRVGYCSDDVDGFGAGFTTHQFCLLLSISSERVNYDILRICGVCLM